MRSVRCDEQKRTRGPCPRRPPAAGEEGPTLTLIRPLERSLGGGHPWIWRESLRGEVPEPGAVVTVLGRRGEFVARGIADAGPIAVRVMTTDRREPVDGALLKRRIRRACELRDRLVPSRTSAYRLLHGEGDGLPGIVCDVYGPFAVLRLDGAGAARWLEPLTERLLGELEGRGVRHLLLRSGRGEQRRLAAVKGSLPAGPIVVTERGMKLVVDLCHGQKTGLFLDHRESRWLTRRLCQGQRVLNLFGYTGGFSVAAGLGGARRVDTVDVAAGALELARQSWELNALPAERHETHTADAFDLAEGALRRSERWGVVISDPPSFAPNAASRSAALRAYVRLHRLCCQLTEPGGLLLAASCSSHVDRVAFLDTLLDAGRAAGTALQIVGQWGAGADHPRPVAFPEGDYLKVLLLRRS